MAQPLYEDDSMQVGGGGAPSDGAAAAGMTYSPTLMIGLGGTGAEVLLRVKKLLQERNADYQNSLHKFLFIDTDLDTFSKQAGLPEVETSEKCMIGFDSVQDAIENPGLYSHLWERFPKDELGEGFVRRLAKGNGASQIRSLGAFALALDYDSVRDKIQGAYDELIELSNMVETRAQSRGASISGNVVVYLVGSLAGGTGSGCFLDVALTAHDVCKARNPELAGMFALPSAFVPEITDPEGQTNVQANTYAALKELQFCLDTGTEEREEIGTIPFDYGSELATLPLDPHEQVFNLCFLVNDRSSSGKLTKIEDLYSLMARSIYQEVGARFGANLSSFSSNLTTSTGVAVCKKTGKKRLFGTISNSSLVYPAERVANYCTYRTADSLIHDHLIGASLPTSDAIQGIVSTFLGNNQLDDRGSDNQILESVLHDPRYGGVLSADAFALDSSWEDLDAGEFVSRIESEWDRFTNTEFPRLKELAEDNRKQRLGVEDEASAEPLLGIVEDLALSVAADNGARAASEVLEELVGVAKQIKSEFQDETEQWRTDKETLRQDFNDGCDKLAQTGGIMSGIRTFFSDEDERLKKQLMALYGDYVQEALWAAARPEAFEVVDKLLNRARDVKTKWDALIGTLKRLRRTTRRSAGKLETRTGHRRAERFVVEQEATLPGYERRYYEANKPEDEQALATALASFDGGRETLYQEALDMSEGQLGNALAKPMRAQLAPPLRKTKLADFVEDHPEEVDENPDEHTMRRKLEVLFDLCQPFWSARAVGGVNFPDFKALSIKEVDIDSTGQLQYPAQVAGWAGQEDYKLLPSPVPYEVTLSRRTYGARAFYLRKAEDWKLRYQTRQESSRGRYMLESHVAFREAPDLFPKPPEDTRPLRFFALGTALGFIVRRGDWYYYGLEEARDGDRDIIRVLYESRDWTTVHELDGAPGAPDKAGMVDFSKKRNRVDKQRHQLAQGRENALDALAEEEAYVDLLEWAFGEYHQSIGNDALRQQLRTYCQQVLEPKERGEDIFFREREEVLDRLNEIGR